MRPDGGPTLDRWAARRGRILSDFSLLVARLLQGKKYEVTFETIKASNLYEGLRPFCWQGIRCLCDGRGRNGFLVIIGKATKDSEAPYSMYEWDGAAGGATRRLNVVFAKQMKPEGITRGSIGGRSALVIVDDGGGFQVVWDDNRLPLGWGGL